ncbi:MAG: fatty acid desaturase, partial [Acidobacteriota bacterium]
MGHYYADHTIELRSQLGQELSTEDLRALHEKRPALHLLIALALTGVLILATAVIVRLEVWYFWLPVAIISGFAIFDFTILLHEVVHRAVVDRDRGRLNRLIGLLYAIPSGISATQFTRWHLDHHASLGSYEEDPKRHYLSPKRNARWFKALYFTPALFPIYFRAARTEARSYSSEMQKQINFERNLTILSHLVLLALVTYFAGFYIAWKTYLVPYFFVFPFAFALNRLGQHYDIDPSDPAKWSTLVRGSWFWDVVYLFSNYHLEHHYFPSVPFYNLPR